MRNLWNAYFVAHTMLNAYKLVLKILKTINEIYGTLLTERKLTIRD